MLGTPEEVVQKARIFMGNARVAIKEARDLIPYYTNLISMMYSSANEQVIHLTQDSYIDIEERERLSWRIVQAIKLARKLKRPLTEADFDEQNTIYGEPALVWAIIDRVNSDPTITKLHLPRDYRESLSYVEHDVIPRYFYGIHTAGSNAQRERFIEFAKEHGFSTFTEYDSTKVKDGEFHPLITELCREIIEYKELNKRYKEAH